MGSEPPSFARTMGLGHWLARHPPTTDGLGPLFQAYCGELMAHGLPVWRSSLILEILHPEMTGGMLTWVEGTLARQMGERTRTLINPEYGNSNSEYFNSPLRIVDETNRPFRRRLDQPSPDLQLLEELRADSATDYIIFPLPFLDTTRSAALSFATRVPAGFSEADLADLEQAAAIFSPYVERYVLRRVAIDLLETYVGPRTAERIFAGRIVRGQSQTIMAAICMADLRGFTRLADSAPREKVIAALDDWFECLTLAVEAHDGEILKFMGDGLLAIYAVDGSPEEACERALAAALRTLSALHALNIHRAAAGEDRLACGFGLHLGEVAYGNVGGPRRLDFTVIGPAVNLAARLEGLTRKLGATVLMSEAFALSLNRTVRPFGRHAIRGLNRMEQVFGLPDSSSFAL
jgi:adenylate cyclase